MDGYPHRHETPQRPDYDPMPPRPPTFGALVAFMRAEYIAEIPDRLHVHQVPDHTEPIPLESGHPEGATMDVTDSGQLGGIAFSPAFHRRIGAIKYWQGELVLADKDMAPFPWARQLEGVRRWCSAKHRTWYEHQERPLCWILLRHVTFGGYSVGRASELEGVSELKGEELLAEALGKWFAWVSNDLNSIEMRKRRPSA